VNQPAQPTQPRITLGEIAFDSAHLERDSTFWAELLGGDVTGRDDYWHSVKADGLGIGIQLAPDHVPPQWPDGQPQQVHLDLNVEDITAAHAHAVSVGATLLQPADGPDSAKEHGFVVYADPSGHPFCLCW